MRSYPIDTDRVTLISTGVVTPVAKWVELADGSRRPDPNGRQECDDAGRALWRVEVITPADPTDERDKTAVVEILIASNDRPEPGTLGTRLTFDGSIVDEPVVWCSATCDLLAAAPRPTPDGHAGGASRGSPKPPSSSSAASNDTAAVSSLALSGDGL